jgi:plastocyanin
MKINAAFSVATFVGCLCGGMVSSLEAQKWADLSMTVVYDGTPPTRKPLNMVADPKCGPGDKAPADDLIVDPTTKGIANIVFMVDSKKSKLKNEQIHPDLQSVPTGKPILDNVQCKFVPHILRVRSGQTITVKNSDDTGHNAKFDFFNNEPVNPLVPAGGTKDVFTTTDEKAPMPVTCNIHPWMTAHVIVTDHPYVSISDEGGKIRIEKLPAGVPLEFKLWHESQNKLEEVTLAGKSEKWVRGFVTLTLKEGANDLGTLLIKPDKFKEK